MQYITTDEQTINDLVKQMAHRELELKSNGGPS